MGRLPCPWCFNNPTPIAANRSKGANPSWASQSWTWGNDTIRSRIVTFYCFPDSSNKWFPFRALLAMLAGFRRVALKADGSMQSIELNEWTLSKSANERDHVVCVTARDISQQCRLYWMHWALVDHQVGPHCTASSLTADRVRDANVARDEHWWHSVSVFITSTFLFHIISFVVGLHRQGGREPSAICSLLTL